MPKLQGIINPLPNKNKNSLDFSMKLFFPRKKWIYLFGLPPQMQNDNTPFLSWAK